MTDSIVQKEILKDMHIGVSIFKNTVLLTENVCRQKIQRVIRKLSKLHVQANMCNVSLHLGDVQLCQP